VKILHNNVHNVLQEIIEGLILTVFVNLDTLIMNLPATNVTSNVVNVKILLIIVLNVAMNQEV
jgi:hypothetical protein